MAECIFCKIASGEVPATIVYRDDSAIAIEDLNPAAPVHLLIIPLEHHGTIVDCSQNTELLGRLMAVAAKLGRERGRDGGFRLVVNTGPEGGQTVGHVHIHMLAGRRMTWPPG